MAVPRQGDHTSLMLGLHDESLKFQVGKYHARHRRAWRVNCSFEPARADKRLGGYS